MKKSTSIENKVEKILTKVRPYVQMHGGDVFLQNVKDGVVTLQITGACKDCSLSDLTYNKMLGSIIMEEVPNIKKIVINN